MEYLIDLRFEDKKYNAIIHFVATFVVRDHTEAQLFYNELMEGFKRKGVVIFPSSFMRIDNDLDFKTRMYEYCEFIRNKATASINIEQFLLDKPNQEKTLADNLIEKFFSGENATAQIGNKYSIPVRVLDKNTRNPITDELFYFTVEHLITVH